MDEIIKRNKRSDDIAEIFIFLGIIAFITVIVASIIVAENFGIVVDFVNAIWNVIPKGVLGIAFALVILSTATLITVVMAKLSIVILLPKSNKTARQEREILRRIEHVNYVVHHVTHTEAPTLKKSVAIRDDADALVVSPEEDGYNPQSTFKSRNCPSAPYYFG